MNAYETAAKYMAMVQRAGARHSAKDNAMVQEMHDRACELGAKCHCDNGHPQLKAMVYRHPGHPNQKVHGNRFGGFDVTKESLRRLKGDKEGREKYKANARKKTGAESKPERKPGKKKMENSGSGLTKEQMTGLIRGKPLKDLGLSTPQLEEIARVSISRRDLTTAATARELLREMQDKR